MQNGFVFDNIYVGDSEEDAKKVAAAWKLKADAENAADPIVVETPEESKKDLKATILEKAMQVKELGLYQFDKIRDDALDFYEIAQIDPMQAVQDLPHIAALGVSLMLLPVLSLFLLMCGSGAKPSKKKDGEQKKVKETATASSVTTTTSKVTKRAVKKD